IWARAMNDDATNPRWCPCGVDDFLAQYSSQIKAYDVVDIYIGFQTDILKPVISPLPSAPHEKRVEIMASSLLGYSRGEFRSKSELAQSNLFYYSGCFIGEEYRQKPAAFLRWAKNVCGWVRRHSPERIPVHRCNYSIRATLGV